MGRKLRIGWAQCDITPPRPVWVLGQLYNRVSSYVHDPLTATALVLENGEEQAVLVGMDVAIVQDVLMQRIRDALSGVAGLQTDKISFHATHTHNSIGGKRGMLMDVEYLLGADKMDLISAPDDMMSDEELDPFLIEKVKNVVLSAWESRAPGGISYAEDYAVVAQNRRPVFDMGDGNRTAKMYGACSEKGFLRLEGASDHSVSMLYTFDEKNNLSGVIANVPCPAQVMELHTYLSADFWTSAREQIRERAGTVYVLPLCGAGGDQSPIDLVRYSKTNEKELAAWNAQTGEVLRNFDMTKICDEIGERIAEAVLRGLRKAKNNIQREPVFRHSVCRLSLPLRLESKEGYLRAKAKLEEAKAQLAPGQRFTSVQQREIYDEMGSVLRWELQQKSEQYTFSIHVLRFGELVIATNPFELFCEYGFRIKARCRASQVMIAQITDDYAIYLPTQAALEGGSFSAQPATSYCGPDGGDQLVEETIAAIDALWDEK